MAFFSRFNPNTPVGDTYDLGPLDFNARRRPTDAVLDVRTPKEYGEARVVGAHNVDVTAPDFRERIEALGLDKDEPVYLYCRSGNRSGKAAQVLRDMGFSDVHNVGGLNGLAEAGVEVER